MLHFCILQGAPPVDHRENLQPELPRWSPLTVFISQSLDRHSRALSRKHLSILFRNALGEKKKLDSLVVAMCGVRLLPLPFLLLLLHHAGVQGEPREVKVGILLDLGSSVGKMSNTCISMALDDFYAKHSDYKSRLTLDVRDSQGDVFFAASEAFDLINRTGVKAIIGPQTSEEAEFVAYLGNTSQVPIVSFSATSPSLLTPRTAYLIRATHNDSSGVKDIAAIVQAYGWKNVVTVQEDSDYGEGIIPDLLDALDEIQVRVPFRSIIPSDAPDDKILKELYKLMTMQTRVFVVHMTTSLGSRFFLHAKEMGMMSEESVWIITDGLTDLLESEDVSVIDSMQGVLGVKPSVPESKARDEFLVRFKKKLEEEKMDPPDKALRGIIMLRAYDSVWALAMAAEKVGDFTTGERYLDGSSTDLVLRFSPDGPKLLAAINSTSFKGLGGEFKLNNGQLDLPAFEIVILVGNELTKVEIGDPEISSVNRKSVTWPGNYYAVPRGWVIPTNAKTLRIAVPVKEGFNEFIKVEHDAQTNRRIVTGYCRDVFDLVLQSLPYAVLYEFVNVSGEAANDYSLLVSGVSKGNYDAVIGDISVTSERSNQVDFTLPYSDSGIAMLVPVKDDKSKKAWVFLKPFTLDLWLTTSAFILFAGIVVWCLEHRINEEFGGTSTALEQLGVTFYFSFSTMVFAHRETLIRNLTRLVMIIWVFAVLIITSSYQGSFTSMLTVPQLRPTFQDLESLKKSNKTIGYQDGSFVEDFLRKKKFTNLISLASREAYAEALSSGTVVAIIDEIPYLRIFLAKYCSNYTMIGPIYGTGGLTFAFARGSSLVSDVSNAILKVIEGDKILGIDKAWFPRQTASCPTFESGFGSDPLTLHSFWGLFLITGVASLLAITIFLVSLLYKRNSISRTDFEEGSSLRQKIVSAVRSLHQTNQVSPSGNARPTSRDSINFMAIEDTTNSSIVGEGTSLVEIVTHGRSRSLIGDGSNIRGASSFVRALSAPFSAKSNQDQYENNA